MAAFELRPMGIGDILDTAFRLYRARFATFMIITLTAYVPFGVIMGLIQMVFNLQQPSPFAQPQMRGVQGRIGGIDESSNSLLWAQMAPGGQFDPDASPIALNPTAMIAGGLSFFVLVVIIMPLCQSALVHNVSAGFLGEELGAWDSYRRAAPRLGRMILASILGGLATALGICACVVPGIILALWFMILGPVVQLENHGVFASLGRSRELMSGNLGKGFLLIFVVAILTSIVSYSLAFGMLMIPWPHPFLAGFAQNVVQAVVLPFQVAPGILMYYDLRIRKEAFDLDRLAVDLGRPRVA